MVRTFRERVLAYITQGGRLLVFRHTRSPEAGIQVPGGTVQPGEALEAAALREAEEESGLADLHLRAYLGMREYDLRPWGRDEIEQRHYYHLEFCGQAPETWLHDEMAPSDGTPGPIEFEFYWVRLPDEVPELSGRQGDLLDRVPIGPSASGLLT